MKKVFKNIINNCLKPFHLEIKRTSNLAEGLIDLTNYDQRFEILYQQIQTQTTTTKARCFILYELAKQVKTMIGEVAEVGVYKGGTAKILAKVIAEKPIHLFDTFVGMPETKPEKDIHQKGDFSDTSLTVVKEFLKDFYNLFFYPGFFPATAKPIAVKEFCLVHIDVDIYQSILDSCQFFYSRLIKGGLMLFDDYGLKSCPGAKEAVDGFFQDKKESPIYLPTGQCLIIKL